MSQMPARVVYATAALLCSAALQAAEPEVRFLGALAGQVRSAGKTPQMGATVVLMNRYHRPLQRTTTDADGRFRFDSLIPDYYAVRVAQPSFVPASHDRILVKAGLDSYLTVQLATFLSSIELVYQSPGQSSVLSEDWKWTLRSASATRPVLRFGPQRETVLTGTARSASAFSTTGGILRLSAGDGGSSSPHGSEADLGTAFALATSLFGNNELRFSGNLGYASAAGMPAAGFRTRFARTDPDSFSPAVELTVRQVLLRHRAGQAFLSGPLASRDVPALRSLSLKFQERMNVTDHMVLDYGFALESVAFLERLNYVSPFARLRYELGRLGAVEAGYSSGVPPLDLASSPAASHESRLQQDLSGLALFPRLSLAGNRTRMQRSTGYELSFHKVAGSRTYSAGLYRERVRDLSVAMAGDTSVFDPGDLLPDLASSSSLYDLGSYSAQGFLAGLTQAFGQKWTAGAAYGQGTALTPGAGVVAPAGLRASLRPAARPWATARFAGVLPVTGTAITTAYVWTPSGALVPVHSWLTQRFQPAAGLNIGIRQPLPSLGAPGRIEATAEIRNAFGQGYTSILTADSRQLLLVQFPKTIRGGLSFIF